MENSNFKIIAIRPLKYCNNSFLKVLKKNEIYYFYSDYRIGNIDGQEIIHYENKVVSNLYDIQRKGLDDLKINISAIVGKNGCGKSSIIELLFRAINNIACKYKNLNKDPDLNLIANLRNVKGVNVEFYFHTDKYYKAEVNYKKVKIFKFEGNVRNHFPEENIKLSEIFYTEAVNYSHYAYNTHEFGNWLKELFHKNDSYQTPLVLNPMRTTGNFDINTENELINQRLLVNLLREDNKHFLKFGDNLKASKLVFSLKERKHSVIYYEKIRENKFVEKRIKLSQFTDKKNIIITLVQEHYLNILNFDKKKINPIIYELITNYILYKAVSIAVKYSDYRKYKSIFLIKKNDSFDKERFVKYLSDLRKDTSHIVFKFNQTINYLKVLHNENKYFRFSGSNNEYTFIDLADDIRLLKKENQNIIELLPPPIFNTEILLEKLKIGEDEQEFIQFSRLSSGEKQLIFSVSSILYHLYNIDSVTNNKIQYKNINIVFEEIELYFHPELQKSFVKYFLDSVSHIDLKNIKSINICFITHSPFILSDIPSNNIMFLEVLNGKAVQIVNDRKTFGANIHELLTDNFFMSSGFIGDFAKNKIDKTIDWLNEQLVEKRLFEKATKGDQLYMLDEEELKFHKGIISIIDEPIIRIKLCEMLSELEPNENGFYNKLIIEQIANLQAKLK